MGGNDAIELRQAGKNNGPENQGGGKAGWNPSPTSCRLGGNRDFFSPTVRFEGLLYRIDGHGGYSLLHLRYAERSFVRNPATTDAPSLQLRA
jgi:hypothetical protein